MKRFKILAYVIIMFILIIVGLLIYKNINKDKDENIKEKTSSEVKYLESKLVNLINSINNIKDENYSISISKIPAKSKNESSGSSTSTKGESQSNSKDEMGGKQEESRKF